MGPGQRSPILVVEDNFETRDVLARVLSIRGYEVATARDGVEALAYLRGGGEAAVIVLDLRMPRMDGEAFRDALKEDARLAAIPIVIFSAAPPHDPGDAAGIVRKGSDDPELLLGLIARASDQTRH